MELNCINFVGFQMYPCFQLMFPDVLTPLQMSFSGADVHGLRIMNITDYVHNSKTVNIIPKNNTYSGVKTWKKLTKNKQNVKIHKSFNQFIKLH